jgi:hypothetical protein
MIKVACWGGAEALQRIGAFYDVEKRLQGCAA